MNKYIILTVALLSLSGCVSPAEIEAGKKEQCANMGAPQGSKNYYHCRQELEYQELLEDKIRSEKMANAAAIYSAMNPEPQVIHRPLMRMSMSCRSYAFGSSINTDCS